MYKGVLSVINNLLVIWAVENSSSRGSEEAHWQGGGGHKKELEAILWHAECFPNQRGTLKLLSIVWNIAQNWYVPLT